MVDREPCQALLHSEEPPRSRGASSKGTRGGEGEGRRGRGAAGRTEGRRGAEGGTVRGRDRLKELKEFCSLYITIFSSFKIFSEVLRRVNLAVFYLMFY